MIEKISEFSEKCQNMKDGRIILSYFRQVTEMSQQKNSFEHCLCCNHSAGVELKCAVHHKRMCVRTTLYVVQTSNNRVILSAELYCCLLPQCEALCTCCSGFPIATKWCCDRDVKVMPGSAFTQRTCKGVVCCKKEGMLLQPLCWCRAEMRGSPRTECARRTTLYLIG